MTESSSDVITNPQRPHVAGYLRYGEYPFNIIKWLVERYRPSTVLDVGSGPFGSKKLFNQFGCAYVWTLDGDPQLLDRRDSKEHLITFSVVDLERSGYRFPTRFDLVWSYECAEHITNVENYVHTLVVNCENILAITHAVPGQGGYSHVNLQNDEYWIKKITAQGGFRYLENETMQAKAVKDDYFSKTGLIFQRIK